TCRRRSSSTCCPPSGAIAMTKHSPGQYYGKGLYEYAQMAEISLGQPSKVLIRPKLWWLERISEAGFNIVGDVGGHGLLARACKNDRRPLMLGTPSNISVQFAFDASRNESTTFGEVWLTCLKSRTRIGF